MRIVVFLEGGLVAGVVDLDSPRPSSGIEYEVMDYDVLEGGDSPEEVREYLDNKTPELLAYMKRYLPEEYARFQEAIKES